MVQIEEKRNCCGCEACFNVCPINCISMEVDEEGFQYPIVNKEKCINCKKCEKVCPIITGSTYNNRDDWVEGYAAINYDTDTRMQSSSGGVFSLLAQEIINLGGLVVGSAMSKDCRLAQHIIVDNKEDLKLLLGSKYLQSNIGKIYGIIKSELENNRIILFSGTPCQVNALHNYLGKKYDTLFCIDLICHGVPSPGLWKKNVEYIEGKTQATLKNVNFRYKKEHINSEYGVLYQNTYYKAKDEDIYFRIFMKDLSLRLSCYSCKFKGISRISDITLGDFWGIREFVPSMDDGKGVSLVVVQSEKGEQLLTKIKTHMKTEQVDIKKVFATHNEAMTRSSELPSEREEFWKDFQICSFENLGKKYVPLTIKEKTKSILRKTGLLEKIRNFKGGGNKQ